MYRAHHLSSMQSVRVLSCLGKAIDSLDDALADVMGSEAPSPCMARQDIMEAKRILSGVYADIDRATESATAIRFFRAYAENFIADYRPNCDPQYRPILAELANRK